MTLKTPRVGLIGCGRWGRNIARVLAGEGALEAIAVRRPETVAAFAKSLGVEVVRPGDLLRREDVDAVALAVPPHEHRGLVEVALAAGKHVFVEKPLALSTADALACKAAAEKAGKVLMVGHIMRHNPAFQRLAGLIGEGAIGRVRQATSLRYVMNPGGDPLWLLAPHDLSMLLALFGPPSAIEAEWLGEAYRLQLGHDGGIKAIVEVGRDPMRRHSKLTVEGKAGVLVYEDTAEPGRKLRLNGEPVAVDPVEPLVAELRHFLGAVQGGRAPLTDAAEGMVVVELLEQASRQTKTRRR